MFDGMLAARRIPGAPKKAVSPFTVLSVMQLKHSFKIETAAPEIAGAAVIFFETSSSQ